MRLKQKSKSVDNALSWLRMLNSVFFGQQHTMIETELKVSSGALGGLPR
jgi:hypothetical protein